MAIRVTQHTMYNNMVGHMQKNLGAYMESVEQGSSQKKINRPSDDPAGTYRVLTTRVDIDSTKQYQENVDTAKGWLNLADDVLSRQATAAITGLKTLAEQASTGTYNAEQRKIMADQARQYFGQLLNLSNTEFEGNSIFAGHKYDKNAFEEGLAATTWDEKWSEVVNNGGFQVSGSTTDSIAIQFPSDPPDKEMDLDDGLEYRWTNDGGETWKNGTVVKEGDNFVLKPEGTGVVITIPSTYTDADGTQQNIPAIKGADTEKKDGFMANGTSFIVRPTAIYQGDDKDPPVDITPMVGNLDAATIKAEGSFGTNVMVRVDGKKGADGKFTEVDLTKAGEDFYWSYSTDGGSTWVTAKGKVPAKADDTIRLPIPGGLVDIKKSKDTSIKPGSEILVHPSRADLDYEIMKDTYLSVNSVGKDVFGGYYNGKPAMKDNEQNLFEVVGSFIGYLECNSQEGAQKTLAALTKAEEKMLKEATRIGGMENRLEMAADVLTFQKIDQQERLSYVEDIDLTELLTKLTRQQLTYQTVLQSSSMIMQLSLANYI